MAIIYIIENSVIYNPSAHTLCAIKNGSCITLAIPASLCLNLLIKNKGKIITQAELLHNVWEVRGMNVTPNTLYQNISLLRKSLNNLGIHSLVIQTISKRGFMLSDETTISMQNEEYDLIPDEPVTTRKINETAVHKPEPVMNEYSMVDSSPSFTWKKLSVWKYAAIIVFFILLVIICIDKFYNSSAPITSYSRLSEIKNCIVFRNNDLQPDSYYINFIKEKNITCSQEQIMYITNNYPSTRTSIIICRFPITADKKSYCSSTYYLK